MFLLRAILNILVRNASTMCFWCLISCELFYCLMDLRSGECDVVSLYILCLTVCELFGETICIMFGRVCYFVVECYGLVKCGWKCSMYVWSSKECVCCICDPSERLDAPSICFVCVFVCPKLSPHLGM